MAGKDASGIKPHLDRKGLNSLRHLLAPAALLCAAAVALMAADTTTAQSNPAPPAGPQPAKSSVMAVVNGEQISRQDLGTECLRRYGTDVLDRMAHKQIILQACLTRDIKITNQEVEEEIHRTAVRFGLDVHSWLKLLQTERDVNPQQYRKDIVWPTLALRRLAAHDVQVTVEEYQQAFKSEYGPKVKVRLIAVTSRQKADLLLKQAQTNPDNFGQLAKEHSEDKATASAYGVIPPIRMHVGDPLVEKTAFALQEGQVSSVIQVGNQYIILKCEKQIPQIYISSEQLATVEKQLKARIREHKLRMQSVDVFQRLQAQTKTTTVYGDRELQSQYPNTAAIVNSQQITVQQLSDECVARHGKEVLEGEINRRLLLQELRRTQQTVEDQDISREIARAADSYGYMKPDGSPDIDAWLKAVTEDDVTTVELYVRDAVWPSVALKKLVGSQVDVTEDDLKKGFDSNFGERVEALAIVFSNHRQAAEVWGQARDNPTDQYFGELAHQYSIEPASRANFGKVPPLRQHGGQPLLEREAFKLQPGELSGIIAVGDKYIILRCLGRTDPVVKDFAAVKDELTKDIQEKKLRLAMADKFEHLMQSAQIDNFLANTTQSGKPGSARTATPASYNAPSPSAGSPVTR